MLKSVVGISIVVMILLLIINISADATGIMTECVNDSYIHVVINQNSTVNIQDTTYPCANGCIRGECITRNATFEIGTMTLALALALMIFLIVFRIPFFAGMIVTVIGIAGTSYDTMNPYSIIIAFIGFILVVYSIWDMFSDKKQPTRRFWYG